MFYTSKNQLHQHAPLVYPMCAVQQIAAATRQMWFYVIYKKRKTGFQLSKIFEVWYLSSFVNDPTVVSYRGGSSRKTNQCANRRMFECRWFIIIFLLNMQLGKLIAAISRGRKDIVSMLKRTRYKEIRRAALETKNPAKTGLPLSFHVRDLVGLGMVREFETPSGAFLRLSPETWIVCLCLCLCLCMVWMDLGHVENTTLLHVFVLNS